MSKDLCLKKAYDAATVNSVVRSVEEGIDVAIIKLGMEEYAKKNNVALTAEEIEAYIQKEAKIQDALTADFRIQTKMMN